MLYGGRASRSPRAPVGCGRRLARGGVPSRWPLPPGSAAPGLFAGAAVSASDRASSSSSRIRARSGSGWGSGCMRRSRCSGRRWHVRRAMRGHLAGSCSPNFLPTTDPRVSDIEMPQPAVFAVQVALQRCGDRGESSRQPWWATARVRWRRRTSRAPSAWTTPHG